MKVVLDTGFISSLFKINKLNLIKKLFNVKTVSIPNAVLRELTGARFFKEKNQGKVRKLSPKKMRSCGHGEFFSGSLGQVNPYNRQYRFRLLF